MKRKKFIATAFSMLVLISLMGVGVWAAGQINAQVTTTVSFTAKGVGASINGEIEGGLTIVYTTAYAGNNTGAFGTNGKVVQLGSKYVYSGLTGTCASWNGKEAYTKTGASTYAKVGSTLASLNSSTSYCIQTRSYSDDFSPNDELTTWNITDNMTFVSNASTGAVSPITITFTIKNAGEKIIRLNSPNNSWGYGLTSTQMDLINDSERDTNAIVTYQYYCSNELSNYGTNMNAGFSTEKDFEMIPKSALLIQPYATATLKIKISIYSKMLPVDGKLNFGLHFCPFEQPYEIGSYAEDGLIAPKNGTGAESDASYNYYVKMGEYPSTYVGSSLNTTLENNYNDGVLRNGMARYINLENSYAQYTQFTKIASSGIDINQTPINWFTQNNVTYARTTVFGYDNSYKYLNGIDSVPSTARAQWFEVKPLYWTVIDADITGGLSKIYYNNHNFYTNAGHTTLYTGKLTLLCESIIDHSHWSNYVCIAKDGNYKQGSILTPGKYNSVSGSLHAERWTKCESSNFRKNYGVFDFLNNGVFAVSSGLAQYFSDAENRNLITYETLSTFDNNGMPTEQTATLGTTNANVFLLSADGKNLNTTQSYYFTKYFAKNGTGASIGFSSLTDYALAHYGSLNDFDDKTRVWNTHNTTTTKNGITYCMGTTDNYPTLNNYALTINAGEDFNGVRPVLNLNMNIFN